MENPVTLWSAHKFILAKLYFQYLCRTRLNFSNQMSRSTLKSNILSSLRCYSVLLHLATVWDVKIDLAR